MIANVITSVFSVASGVVTGLSTLFGAIIELLYADSALTTFGQLVILVAAVPLAWNILTYFVNLFKSATKIKGR
jgi:low temperature requirement protein LtrA